MALDHEMQSRERPVPTPSKLSLVGQICRDVGLAIVARELSIKDDLEGDLATSIRRGARFFSLLPPGAPPDGLVA